VCPHTKRIQGNQAAQGNQTMKRTNEDKANMLLRVFNEDDVAERFADKLNEDDVKVLVDQMESYAERCTIRALSDILGTSVMKRSEAIQKEIARLEAKSAGRTPSALTYPRP
jgi:hypothetical protein